MHALCSLGGLFLGMSPLAKLFLSKGAPLSLVTNAVETLGKVLGSFALRASTDDSCQAMQLNYGHFGLRAIGSPWEG